MFGLYSGLYDAVCRLHDGNGVPQDIVGRAGMDPGPYIL